MTSSFYISSPTSRGVEPILEKHKLKNLEGINWLLQKCVTTGKLEKQVNKAIWISLTSLCVSIIGQRTFFLDILSALFDVPREEIGLVAFIVVFAIVSVGIVVVVFYRLIFDIHKSFFSPNYYGLKENLEYLKARNLEISIENKKQKPKGVKKEKVKFD